MQQNHNMAHVQPTSVKIKALPCLMHASDSFRAFPLTNERGKHQQTTTGSFASLESSKKNKKITFFSSENSFKILRCETAFESYHSVSGHLPQNLLRLLKLTLKADTAARNCVMNVKEEQEPYGLCTWTERDGFSAVKAKIQSGNKIGPKI